MDTIPQIAFPLRFSEANDGTLVTVEQGSDEEVLGCVEVILRYRQGDRAEFPEFGIPDLAFSTGDINLQVIQDQVAKLEPRAKIQLSQERSPVSEAISHVIAEVSANG